ncbi:MAG: NADH dehydrogenase subunit E [Planctomycetota bacterium]|nr:MAG: NADH dehydrogenase subunit E [Planctomycetota bacterium]
MFPDELVAELEEIRSCFPVAKAAMVPVLRRVQEDRGWIDPEARDWVAEFLSVTKMEVHEVATFYPMLYTEPVGKHVIHVCRTLSCDVCGARELWAHLEKKLKVERGGTTEDGRFTLKSAECLASCGTAPVMLIDNERHENLSLAEVDKLLEATK